MKKKFGAITIILIILLVIRLIALFVISGLFLSADMPKDHLKDADRLIEKHALANAFLHDGKAQVGAIIGKLIPAGIGFLER